MVIGVGVMLLACSALAAAIPPAVEMAGPRVMVLVFIADDATAPPAQQPEAYAINGKPPVKVGRLSRTVYEEKCTDWQKQRYPQVIEHRIYLVLPEPLKELAKAEIRFPGGNTELTMKAAEIACESFRVNQVGYHRDSIQRDAFFAAWCGDLGMAVEAPADVWLCDARSGREIARAPLRPVAADPVNGGPYWRVDLSAMKAPGQYYLRMAGTGRSPGFFFGDEPAHHTFYAHLKGFYHQRCGVALERPWTDWERPACHTELEVTDVAPPDFIKERGQRKIAHVGGHHDAGDFDVRLGHTLVAGWLLNAYELFPAKFVDGQLDIPEGRNGIPDLLDEAIFSIRAWECLQEDDGGIRAGFESDRHPTYGEVNAGTDKLVYRTFCRYGHTTLAGGALMAYAARMVRPFDAPRADGLLARAKKAWDFYERHREDAAYQWSPGALLFASGQLYLATGEERYHSVFKEQARTIFELDGRKSQWPAQYHGTYFNIDTVDKGASFTHYFISYVLDTTRPKDAAIVQAIRAAVIRKADEVMKKLSGDGFATVSTAGWGASTGVGRYGDFLIHAHRLTGDERYHQAALRLADWVLGANPLGRCFTSGLGASPPFNPLHLDSYAHLRTPLGPAPGLVIYGITDPPGGMPYIKVVTQHLYPAMPQRPPAMRFTDGWSVVEQNEFTVWETMAPNAFLHACLAPDIPMKGRIMPWSPWPDRRLGVESTR
ncbi:MAG: glycoside hydrolase family 9 protein [Tepidisphaerales bacterium]